MQIPDKKVEEMAQTLWNIAEGLVHPNEAIKLAESLERRLGKKVQSSIA